MDMPSVNVGYSQHPKIMFRLFSYVIRLF